MSEIERAARAWARYKRDAVGTPAGYELDLLRAIESTPPEPAVTLTVEEAETLDAYLGDAITWYLERARGLVAEQANGLRVAIRLRIAKARGAGR